MISTAQKTCSDLCGAHWHGVGGSRCRLHHSPPPKPANNTEAAPFATHLNRTDPQPAPENLIRLRYEVETTPVLPPAVAKRFYQHDHVACDAIEPWEIEPDAAAPEYEWGSRTTHKTYTAHDFWSLIERGEPNACWSWKGSFNRTTPVYNIYGRGHGAARYGWGLIHGVLPESKAVRHTCGTACMNPRHWYLSDDCPPTGCEAVRQFTPFDRDRFLGLHRSGALPMRVLAATFGIPERIAWSMIGLSQNRVAKLSTTAEWDAARAAAVSDETARNAFVRDKELAIEREKRLVAAAEREAARAVQRAIREAAEKVEREARAIEAAELEVERAAERERRRIETEERLAFEASRPRLFCSTCDKDVQVHSTIASTMTVLPRGLIGFVADMEQSCGLCQTHIRRLNYKFTSILVAAHRKHLVEHGARVEHSVRPIVMSVGNTAWRHGIKASALVECRRCGFQHVWDVDRWVAVNNKPAKASKNP